ncbi:hypothetical protein [Lonomia obliqua multiple nucleopolyhedrovirus]|uniref:Uncharacterized protein n=1 Tax=Lonomia obliqua multiple nucleopolyhedrovirus TaxID=134394 RepID=A0A126FCH1_9ABAC|nr:hypothetical protein [Lonomia obliqua multiple nucleopolyhedrovirus]AKN81075.1 hypothetical protein [Lonomia obliqua multiple nucleopolyhedrovirus]
MINTRIMSRLHRVNAQIQQNGLNSLFFNNSHIFYKLTNILFTNSGSVANLCSTIDTLVQLERTVYGKSLLLNGIMNFLITNSDGNMLQNKIFVNVLSVMLTKYY